MKSYISNTISAGLLALLALFQVLIDCAKNLPAADTRRQQLVNPLRGEIVTVELLYGPPKAIKSVTRLDQRTFQLLLEQLVNQYNLREQEGISAAQKLMIFMAIVGGGQSMRYIGWKFQHSTDTVSHAFHEVLDILCRLHKDIVKLPPNRCPNRIESDNKMWPFFTDCIGALDGSHIPISVPEAEHGAWRNRKGWISQNVLAACDFDMNFVYILPGWEGSAHDGRVLSFAKDCGFDTPPGRYYLADAGYAADDPLVLVPYQKVRYHLKEQARSAQRPKNKQELFNLRHAQLRNIIERTFGVLKARFLIFDKGRRGYSRKTQIKIVWACTALHNFMNQHGCDPREEDTGYESEDDSETDQYIIPSDINEREMSRRREDIAQAMWEQYQEVLATRGGGS